MVVQSTRLEFPHLHPSSFPSKTEKWNIKDILNYKRIFVVNQNIILYKLKDFGIFLESFLTYTPSSGPLMSRSDSYNSYTPSTTIPYVILLSMFVVSRRLRPEGPVVYPVKIERTRVERLWVGFRSRHSTLVKINRMRDSHNKRLVTTKTYQRLLNPFPQTSCHETCRVF